MKALLERHAMKLLVVLIAAVVLVPAALAVNYSKQNGKTGEEAKEAATQAKALARTTTRLTIRNHALIKRLARIQKRVTRGLIRSCRVNGNPLRTAFQTLLREQIGLSENLKPSALPNLKPAQFHRLIDEGIAAKRRAIHRVDPIPCAAEYTSFR